MGYRLLAVVMVQRLDAGAGVGELVRFPPGGFAGASLEVGWGMMGPVELDGPGALFHGAVAAAELGAEDGGEEGELAEEGLQDGEAAADDGKVDFDDPAVRQLGGDRG